MEVVQFILDAICGNYLIVLPVLFILGSISAYNVAKRQANAYRRPLLRSNNDCLEYYDYRIEVWLPVYGREDMGSYEWFHILGCESIERLEFYQKKWQTVRELELWIKKQKEI